MPDSRHAPSPRQDHRPDERRRRPIAVIALAVILGLEAALVAALAVWVGVELLTQHPDSYASAVAIFVIAVLAAVWVIATLVAVLALRAWARASSVTIQILQLAVAVGCFQGLYARPDVGWALLVPAVIAGALSLSGPVVRATSRNTEQHE